ncbi:MAG: peptidase M61 [Alphaproteobacteria bacterium]|nr:peptidase M61 [Alphaproteobacteria bacterium]MBU2271431.1 peptidase M61 [Alphaproteobacteria bacterium]MBU2398756.1 peptidase M61 [Alphaproteobacteria bacterium]
MLKSAALALLLVSTAAPALAQVAASQAQTPLPAPTSLPRPLPPIPAPQDRDYPGTIGIRVDLTDLAHKVIRVNQTVPVSAGPLVLQYPKFIPGNHADTGPIQLISGLTVTGNGQRVEWLRDTVDPHALHLDIPAGVETIEVDFEWLTQPDNSTWRVVMTEEIVNLQWEKAVLYPAGYSHGRITFAPSVVLPEGWDYGVALDTVSRDGNVATFAPISLEHLADSPMFAGKHYRRIDIDPGGRSPVHLNLVGDTAASINPSPEWIGKYEALVDQADRLFGARHFDRYEFLLGLTSKLGGIGLEHHRSSENTASPTFFTAPNPAYGSRVLLPHEYVHSWNGKYRRPSDELVANFNVPTQNSLMWVYEGQTQYWGDVLTPRSGLGTVEEAVVNLAGVAAFYENQPGREWRALQDTTNHNLLGYRTSNPWPSWMRGTGDYYREALLIWLDADTLIREATRDRKSLDDFAKSFYGAEDGVWEARPYTFEDVVEHLNAVHPHDWASFLRTRLDAVGPGAQAPLDGIERAGWRLTYVDELTPLEKRMMGGWGNDFQYSLGFSLGAGNRIVGIRWGGPAFEQGLGAGWELVAVGDRTASAEALRNAVTAAKGGSEPISLILKRGDAFRTVNIAWHDGLRYPRLVRIEGTRDRLADIFAPRRR